MVFPSSLSLLKATRIPTLKSTESKTLLLADGRMSALYGRHEMARTHEVLNPAVPSRHLIPSGFGWRSDSLRVSSTGRAAISNDVLGVQAVAPHGQCKCLEISEMHHIVVPCQVLDFALSLYGSLCIRRQPYVIVISGGPD